MRSLGFVGILLASTLAVQAQQPQSVGDGVFTAPQAGRGKAIYDKRCTSCHGANLAGRSGPPLTGDDFTASWSAQPLLELANKIRNTMPKDDSDRLTRQETADLVSYVLQAAKYPNGQAELQPDDAALKRVSFPVRSTPSPAAAAAQPSLPPVGTVAQVMRGILFPSSNIIFTTQSIDPGEKKPVTESASVGFDWLIWGGNVYKGWDVVDYAAVAVGDSAELMLTPGRRCENGRLAPVTDPDWIKFSKELADAGRAAYKAAQTRKQDVISESTNQLNDSCQHCHGVYRGRTHCVK